ncbi:MAG: tetratricopeptide repeat protein [Firmicutes bacterium]|nr:tetratricopeptide repeat protein [Bacillota bacterium]MCM1401056.1 tetratricopeptide repeat protein [Bacteroides sp.]MCM1476975.1 tetratricopeptide repeat protein [Bacteroides sp.]
MKKAKITFLLVAALMLALQGCSLKKNTAASRNYTAFITRYNIYFNGDEHYKKTLAEMEQKYQDDYTRTTLFMHPAEAYADEKAPQPSGDFKRSIEKAQKAIQVRSIKKRPKRKGGKSTPEKKQWLKREEYNPFLHNAWLMMGRSQYMGGDFLGAASTFFYISKHFWWLPQTVTEAELWQARSYIAVDWLFEAEGILRSIKEKELTNSTLQNLYDFDMASLNVRNKNYAEAVPYLTKAANAAKGSQKARLTFLLGQLHELVGDKASAYTAYRKVGGMNSVDYRTKFNARIKQSEVFQGTDIAPEVKSLKALTRYGANKQYLDQIYYAIGNLYLSKADTLEAIENYKKAIELSERKGIESAFASLALGRLYYAQGKYELAQPCYSSAVPRIPDNYPGYADMRRRSDVLDELAVYSQNVTLQDSLLRLSEMSPEEQRKVVDRIIEELKKKENEEAENLAREEYMAQQAAAGNGLNQSGNNAPSTFALNTDKSWYFYNEATRNAGRTEFQKRWGSRKLEDDWRRRNKASFSQFAEPEETTDGEEGSLSADDGSGESPDEGNTEENAEALEHASDPHYPEYYLRQIPKTEAEKTTANEVIQEGLYNMGVILKDKMQDFPGAEREFEQLLSRYPDNVYRLDAYYNLYLMFMLSDKPAEAERYRQLILTDFPNTAYGEALSDPDYMDKLRRMTAEEGLLYDEAYAAYMANDNTTVHSIYAKARKDFPMSRIMPKFMFLEALSYVTDNNPELFEKTLKELTERYAETDVAPLASSYLKLLAEGRKFNTNPSNVRGMVWSTRFGGDSAKVSMANEPAKFTFRADTAQSLLLIYPTAAVDANRLLFDVARHNFTTYSVRDFDLEQMRLGQIGVLIVSGFHNRREAETYRTALERSDYAKLPAEVVPLVISDGDFNTLVNESRTLDEYFEAAGDDRLRKVHESVLPPDEFDEPVIPQEAPDSVPSAPEPNLELSPEEIDRQIEQQLLQEMEREQRRGQQQNLEQELEAEPVVEPAEESAPKPSEPAVPAKPQPATKPQAKPTPKPAPKPAPQKPSLPEVPVGSEGDDPLFD